MEGVAQLVERSFEKVMQNIVPLQVFTTRVQQVLNRTHKLRTRNPDRPRLLLIASLADVKA